jgi:hypothetical protein
MKCSFERNAFLIQLKKTLEIYKNTFECPPEQAYGNQDEKSKNPPERSQPLLSRG